MSIINRLPWGLQGLLGSVNQGKNPGELLQEVRPTVDLTPFWGLEQLQFERDAKTLTTRGQVAVLTVPDGEAWQPLIMSGKLNGVNDVGTIFSIGLGQITLDPATQIFCTFASSGLLTSAVIGQIMSFGITFPQPMLFHAGIQLQLRLEEYVPAVGVNDTFELNLIFYRHTV